MRRLGNFFLSHLITGKFFKNRNLVVISFPKTGKTWLRVMLDRLHISPAYSHDGTSHTEQRSYKDLVRDKSRYRNKKIIFLVRDPRDTVVSGYFQSVKRIRAFDGTISDFIRDERHGIKKILTFHHIWFNNKHHPEGFHTVKYEDMHEDCLDVLKKVTDFMQLRNISQEQLKESTEFARFDNMQKLEREGYFEKQYGFPLSPSDKNDKESFKVRKGKVGGYVDYLNEEDIHYCNKCLLDMGTPFYANLLEPVRKGDDLSE
jgi:hypothetical protein